MFTSSNTSDTEIQNNIWFKVVDNFKCLFGERRDVLPESQASRQTAHSLQTKYKSIKIIIHGNNRFNCSKSNASSVSTFMAYK